MSPRQLLCFAWLAAFSALAGGRAFAAAESPTSPGPKTYQLTGEIVAVSARTFTVKRGDETFEIARDPALGVGPLTVGMRATVHYTLVAMSIAPRPSPATKAGAPAAPSPTEKADRAAQKAAERAEKAERAAR